MNENGSIEERKEFIRTACEHAVKAGLRIEPGSIGSAGQGHCCPIGACVLRVSGTPIDLYLEAYERVGQSFGRGVIHGFEGFAIPDEGITSGRTTDRHEYHEGYRLGWELRIKYLPEDED
jgi:hypothetical protein